MAEPTLRFDFHWDPPIEGLSFAVDRFTHDVKDLSELFREFDELFQANERTQFSRQGSRSGAGWADLSPAYAGWKMSTVGKQPIGYLYGHLRAAMTGGEGYEATITPASGEYGMGGGPAMAYGRYFDQGTDHSPARPVIDFGPAEARKWQKATHRYLLTRAREAFAAV